MGKGRGIIAGMLAGGFVGVAKGVVEMSLMEAKQKYEAEKDKRLAEITRQRDELLHGQRKSLQDDSQEFQSSQGIIDREFRQSERQAGQTFTASENAATRQHQEALTARRETGDERRHRESLEARQRSDSNRMSSDEKRDTFIDEQGFVRRKASGEYVRDPETNEPVKGRTPDSSSSEKAALQRERSQLQLALSTGKYEGMGKERENNKKLIVDRLAEIDRQLGGARPPAQSSPTNRPPLDQFFRRG